MAIAMAPGCIKNQLVSENRTHSMRELGANQSAHGLDFMTITKGVYYDLCKRQALPSTPRKKWRYGSEDWPASTASREVRRSGAPEGSGKVG
jgi:hypothetical protein